ncbi:hypothetical protein ACIPL1_30595 [Pseudomonas sp. NPDC090202]|uniref:hypothetical protein n=1 Tax=Pseudomonas sp. NPDC090202 TaxID=3364476 RepID=UPI0038001D65
MANINVTLSVKRAWWVKPYLRSIVLIAHLTGARFDWERVAAKVVSGYKLELK